uniref:Uncharacterized protein n=1 Tax=Aegilops tauschii TaxID=37682 RepID=M8CGI7_AEGTA
MSLSTLSRAIVRVQKKHGIRKERIGEESTWMLSRFYPILETSPLFFSGLYKLKYHTCICKGSGSKENLHWKEAQRIRRTLQKQLEGDGADNSSLDQ